MKISLVILFFLSRGFGLEKVNEIETFKLDHRIVHTVYCHEQNSGITTVIFPSEITGLYAAKVDVKFNKKQPNPFLLSFTPGSSYFSIKSLSSNSAAGAINVVFESKVFVIHLKTVKNGHSSVTFIKPKAPKLDSENSLKGSISPVHLISMLDKAKAYHLIKKSYPQQAQEIKYDSPDTVMEYSTHRILLKEVIRFDREDTVFFHIQIKNKTVNELRYNPKDLAVNISDKIFYSALADANGVIPSKETSTAWFCISSTKSGGRNNLNVKNDWKILLNITPRPKISTEKNKATSTPPIEEKIPIIKTIKEIKIEEAKP